MSWPGFFLTLQQLTWKLQALMPYEEDEPNSDNKRRIELWIHAEKEMYLLPKLNGFFAKS